MLNELFRLFLAFACGLALAHLIQIKRENGSIFFIEEKEKK